MPFTAALVLALLASPTLLFAQRGGMGHGGGGRGGGGHGGGRGGFSVRSSGHISGGARGFVTAPRVSRNSCYGCVGRGHFGRGVARVGVGIRTNNFGRGYGFDAYHRSIVRSRGFSSYAVPYYSVAPLYPLYPFYPYYPSTAVVVVPGYEPFVNNGYYEESAPTTAYEAPPESNYVIASGSAGPAQTTPRLILLAFQDHSIYAVIDYWVQDGTIFYTTSYGARNQAPVNALDLDFTTQLNRERGIDFSLDARTLR